MSAAQDALARVSLAQRHRDEAGANYNDRQRRAAEGVQPTIQRGQAERARREIAIARLEKVVGSCLYFPAPPHLQNMQRRTNLPHCSSTPFWTAAYSVNFSQYSSEAPTAIAPGNQPCTLGTTPSTATAGAKWHFSCAIHSLVYTALQTSQERDRDYSNNPNSIPNLYT